MLELTQKKYVVIQNTQKCFQISQNNRFWSEPLFELKTYIIILLVLVSSSRVVCSNGRFEGYSSTFDILKVYYSPLVLCTDIVKISLMKILKLSCSQAAERTLYELLLMKFLIKFLSLKVYNFCISDLLAKLQAKYIWNKKK